jgi:transposase InsO family protein
MPWKEVGPMDQRRQFVVDARRYAGGWTELCARYGISRKTGYKWFARAEAEGSALLAERSRRPHTCPHATPPELVGALLEVRRHHPHWGPRKLLRLLQRRDPTAAWPARSTAADLLRRHGLIRPRTHRRRLGHPGRPTTPMTAPNEIWTADFKGHFRTGDGVYCYPLTVADGYSRFLLGCQSLPHPSHALTQPVFTRLFREYGLPQLIRTDNGVPFATCALGRLSALSVWWVRLGIFPELIEPASPQQNGRHERMHRTLKRETARPPAGSLAAQQRRFNAFRAEFNQERPHQALGDETPGSCYRPSPRPFPERLPALDYPTHFEIRLVSANGGIRWHHHWVNVSHVLGGEYVGLEEVDDAQWDLYFGPLKLGRFHEPLLRVEDTLGRLRRRRVLPMSPD